MERVWKERLPAEKTLRLFPYPVLSMTPDSGYIKFVPNAVSLSKVFQGDLTTWLDNNRPVDVPLETALETLAGSVAAYCVATYVLGIGDRHLDNMMLTREGSFLHIDFGFVFGADPKPFAPHLRLPSQITGVLNARPVHARDATGYQPENLLDRCMELAGSAYEALRRSMHLWEPLLRIIGEAGGAGCKLERADTAVNFVREKLRLDLGEYDEETAVLDFLQVLTQKDALYPLITDKVHQFAQFWN